MNIRHYRRRGGVTAALVFLGSVVSGVGIAPETVGAVEQPVILLDAHAKCPRVPETDSDICRSTKFGNAVTDPFVIPQGEWGIAYAFKCKKPRDFYAVVHSPGLDGILPGTFVARHARAARGFKMETHNWQDTYEQIPPEWRYPLNLAIDSICSWRVRVVVGDSTVVSRNVPPLPRKA